MFLLDTNVVSELRKVRRGRANPNVATWSDTLDPVDLFISAITIHELEIGVRLAERRDPRQGAMFRAWLEDQVLTTFEDRVLSIDVAVAKRAAGLHVPDPLPINDAFIAATALVHGMTIATRNLADFATTGVLLLNPWDPVD